MKYTEKYFELKQLLDFDKAIVNIDETMNMMFLPFNSENSWERIFETQFAETTNGFKVLETPDAQFFDNNHFTYPVFIPTHQKKFNKALILLHGLNERFWDKYLPWAYYLALYTNRPVIMFPLSFHMNRAPVDWANPRKMAPFVDARNKTFNTESLTFVNLALSSRLTEEPLRFMRSGYQSAEDLIHLSRQIKQGLIPFLDKNAQIDFFAYSIGAFVSQILLLANPNEIFSESKFFQFCGGSFFKDMYGVSKLIMDKTAYETINNFYTNVVDKAIDDSRTLGAFLTEYKLGKAFYAMLKEENNKTLRQQAFTNHSKNIYSVSLLKDKVIPYWGVDEVYSYNSTFAYQKETLDFPFEYCHENPFPVTGKADRHIVDFWFGNVIEKAANFVN